MPSDLTVTHITAPSGVLSPCLNNRIDVEITNVGNLSAPLPIPVCLQVTANPDAPFVQDQVAVIEGLEGGALLPFGGKATISFNTAIPCAATVHIRAVADCIHHVPNNARTNPGQTIVVTPTPVAWLEVDLSVGIQAPNGVITSSPSVLCPGAPDFRYTTEVTMNVPELFDIPPQAERPSLLALRSLIELLNRARAAYEAMGTIHQKAMGAYIDGTTDSVRSQLESYRAALGVLQRIARLLPDTIAEAERALLEDPAYDSDRFREMLESWRSEGHLPDNIRESCREANLPEEGLQQMEELIRRVDTLPDPPTAVLRRITSAFTAFVRALEAESSEVFELEEGL